MCAVDKTRLLIAILQILGYFLPIKNVGKYEETTFCGSAAAMWLTSLQTLDPFMHTVGVLPSQIIAITVGIIDKTRI